MPQDGEIPTRATPERGLAPETVLDRLLTEEPGRILSVLIAALRDFDLAEAVLQEAAAVALERWPRDGVPPNPRGWLVTTARRRAIDRLRRSAAWERRGPEYLLVKGLEAAEAHSAMDSSNGNSIADERLRLIFTCCHPALGQGAQVALTLRTLGGLTTPKIARAFLTIEATMGQPEQNRALWDREIIAQGNGFLAAAIDLGRTGPYQLQAAIAGLHANAPSSAHTNWKHIAELYDQLLEWAPTSVVPLNRAAAYAMMDGPAVGLAMVDEIGGLDDYHLFHATRADLLKQMGRYADAASAYQRALEWVTGEAERAFLLRRLDEVSA